MELRSKPFDPTQEEYKEANNEDPRPFVWTATAESILAKVERARAALPQRVN